MRAMQQPQCADAVLMVRPAAFDYNVETAASNRMQRRGELATEEAAARAKAEFDRLASALRGEGIRVCVADDTSEPPKPDAVFPNNWVSFHADGTVVLYPLLAESRRRERRPEILSQVSEQLGFRARRTLDLTAHEAAGHPLEGTGSLVLDHVARVAYACLSPRTSAEALGEWCREMRYEPVPFRAFDRGGAPIYHTNVLMCIGGRVVVVGTEAIAPEDRRGVLDRLAESGREIIEIGHHGIECFAANALELSSWDEALGDCSLWVMSATARGAFDAGAFARLAGGTDTVLTVDIPTIEQLGGGGVRCMLAEVFCAP
jgi:hypothetical protein